jgi:predicted GNAT superfamily acetyltransferase
VLPAEFVVRDVTSPDELNLCVRLYEDVFHLGPGDGSLNVRLLVGMVRNSGIVAGAFEGDRMIGFALSFLAWDRARDVHYQYSQLAVVAEGAQGRGVGRRLKLAQREASLAMDVAEMRWSFDPFLVRNAHFNLNVLGARAVALERNLYGTHAHGLDVLDSTDRLLAVWNLAEAHDDMKESSGVTLNVPATSSRAPDADARRHRNEVLVAFENLFARQYVAVSCTLGTNDEATYDFALTSSS